MKSNVKILITDKVHPILLKGIHQNNWHVDYKPDIEWSDVKTMIHDYHGIIINTRTKMDQEMLRLAKNLSCIVRLGSGLDIIDLKEAKKRNIHVYRTPEANCNAVAEHVLGMLLCIMNNLNKADTELRNKQWFREKNRGVELSGKTIGIIGFGHTGSSLARKLSCWGLNVLAFDKYKKQLGEEFRFVKAVSLKRLCQESDIISFHVPLTEETHYMLNVDFMGQCLRKPIIVNTSRGKVVDTSILIQGLKSGVFRAACLDVLENEKPFTYTQAEDIMYGNLYQMNNVLLSPHVAGWTRESFENIARVSLNKLEKHFANPD